MKERDKIKKELESLAPGLSRIKKPDRGEVPEGYFESLPDQVLARINAGEQNVENSTSKVRILDRRFLWRAAAIFLVAALGASIFTYVNRGDAPPQLASLTVEERDDYIGSHIEEFEMDMILETVQAEDLDYDWFEDDPAREEALDEYLDEMIQDMDLEDIEQLL